MIDAKLRRYIDPPLNAVGRAIAHAGLTANAVTIIGLAVGLAAAFVIAHGHYWLGLGLIITSRILDGLDGAVARATRKTAFGGYLDIVCDFIFYVSIPLAFGLVAIDNLLPALVLVAAFTITGISFLAFAVAAAETGAETNAHGEKSFFYSTGIAEGAETISCFIAMTLFPAYFGIFAYIFAGLCIATVIQRSALAYLSFKA